MATYIKGVNSYLPDIQPFTPDYKFLSAVLDTRTSKYDANFQAANDLYNKVVYADLSREDNKQKRDQFSETIAPQIEKISGMDLSVQQNVDAAKSVFAPFYQDDEIVKDVVFTSQYRKEMNFARQLEQSPINDQRERYWQTGVTAMQYQMDDFINASPDKALQMKLPTYVENANLFELASDILSEMDPPLKAKIDHYGQNADGSVNTDWIITTQNGELVTGAALQVIQSRLLDDPQVINAYQTDAYVKSRNFAKAGIDAGRFSSGEQGQAAWADETIERINNINEALIEEDTKLLKTLEDANVNWDNWIAANGVIPGSNMDKLYRENMSAAEATQAALDAKLKIRTTGSTPSNTDLGKLNRAYNMLMSFNISGDMQKAAIEYGNRDREVTMRINQLKENQRERDAKVSLENLRSRNKRAEIALEKIGENTSTGLDVFDNTIVSGDAQTIQMDVEVEDGIAEFTPDSDLVDSNFIQEDKAYQASEKRQLALLKEYYQKLHPRGNEPDGNYSMMIGGEKVVGDINTIFNKLSFRETDKKGVDLGFKYADDISANFDASSLIIKDYKNSITGSNDPNITKGVNSKSFNSLYNNYYGLNGAVVEKEAVGSNVTALRQVYKDAYAITEELARSENNGRQNVKLLMDDGFGGIMNSDGSIKTKQEYINEMALKAANLQITNTDRYDFEDNFDGSYSQDDDDYMIDGEVVNSYLHVDQNPTYGGSYTSSSSSTMIPSTVSGGSSERPDLPEFIRATEGKLKGQMVRLNWGDFATDASIVYDGLKKKLNQGMTGQITNQDGKAMVIPTATYNSIAMGKNTETYADLLSNPIYTGVIIPKPGMTSNESMMLFQQFGNQIAKMDRQNPDQYGLFMGDMTTAGRNANQERDIEKYLEKDPLALKIYNIYKNDHTYFARNPKASNSSKLVPKINLSYLSVYGAPGDPNKDFAGYQLSLPKEWLSTKKAGEDPDSQYGALSQADINRFINKYDGKLSFVFPQEFDQNPRRAGATVVSQVMNDINAQGGDYKEYVFQGGDYEVGNVRFNRIASGDGYDYTMNYYLNTYQPGGTYLKSPLITKDIDMTNGLGALDYEYKSIKAVFDELRDSNALAEAADVATNNAASIANERTNQ